MTVMPANWAEWAKMMRRKRYGPMKTVKLPKPRKRAFYDPNPDDGKILMENMDELMKKYPGGWAVVYRGEVFAGRRIDSLIKKAMAPSPALSITPIISRIPRKEMYYVLSCKGANVLAKSGDVGDNTRRTSKEVV